MAESISYVELWIRWSSGPVGPQTILYGYPLYWWARLGKLMAFTGGAVALFDIVRPDRLFRFRSQLYNIAILGSMLVMYPVIFAIAVLQDAVVWVTQVSGTLGILMLAASVIGVPFGGIAVMSRIVMYWTRRIRDGEPAIAIRSLGYALVVFGFHFDILGS